MHSTVVLFITLLYFAQLSNVVQSSEIQVQNFTSLEEALQDAERFILKDNETYNFPSLAFGLSVRGKSVLGKAWGKVDLENGVVAKLSTKYRIGSISKTFTSVIIAGLVDRGLLHYDDPISRYLSESLFPSKEWQGKAVNITIRQLLCHTAGVHVMTDMLKDLDHVERVNNVSETLHRFANEPLQFAPGSHYNYSNYGFQLLGAVVESVTKKPFTQTMTEFFGQHNLTQTYARNMSVVIHDIARYYVSLDPKQPKDNLPTAPFDELVFVEGHWPAGGVISTVDDLTHYGQLLIDSYKGRHNAMISQVTLKQMWSSQAKTEFEPRKSDYGLGFQIALPNPKLAHQHIVYHSGSLLGSTSLLYIYPDEEIVAVALTNKGGIPGLEQMITHAVENVYHLVK